ncbi:MAG: metallophosphoesterase [Candidatus Rokuibacteriota bacterium]
MKHQRFGLGTVALLLAGLAAAAPLVLDSSPLQLVGALLMVAGVLEGFHSFRRVSVDAQRSAYTSAGLTVLMGLLVLAAPLLVGTALTLLLAGSFLVDGVQRAGDLWRRKGNSTPKALVLAALGNVATAAVLLVLWKTSVTWTTGLAGALRIFGTGWNMVTTPVQTGNEAGSDVIRSLSLPEHAELRQLGERLTKEELARRPYDRGWILAFVATLFAIHVGRMQAEWTLVGLLGPVVAVMGDLAAALLIALGAIGPARLGFRQLTWPLERRCWLRVVDPGRSSASPRWLHRLLRVWLTRRLRMWIRLRQIRYSLPFVIERGLQMGLPIVAVAVATVPIWGMSWYFNSENWAAAIYSSWAEHRTDTWRSAMARAVQAGVPAGDPSRTLTLGPPGITGDFAFLVIGDPGEGDASQHILRDQIIRAGAGDAVRFMVISSDVIYPTGSMKNYEANFWLPFKGFEKPVYAIPGNHDWYDALEGFAATFFVPEAARAAMRARVESDNRLTSTTDRRIAWLVGEAARLRREYGVPTGFQHAPYFQIHNERFALLAVDTGVLRRVDPDQLAWLRAGLAQSRGKFTMVILGHPLYAGGQYQAGDDEAFAAIHQLLREHDVAVVMAGDTHDLEHYVERYRRDGVERVMHHVVNGGGGAYLSSGTALAWPAAPAVPEWAFYPSRADVTAKIDVHTPLWKWPFWVWTKKYGAWPFSVEWLSAAFDYNVAPFFQSFIEVRVEPSAARVRLLPWGVRGRLRWADLESSPGWRPSPSAPHDSVEIVLPMRTTRP